MAASPFKAQRGTATVKEKQVLTMKRAHELSPEGDGQTHINIYSKGKTWLGKELSNFAHRPFCHAEHGLFASVEGYWYWLTRQDDRLRHAHGFKAKEMGVGMPTVRRVHHEQFQAFICQALDAKLEQHPDIGKALKESTLPLEHYYAKFYGDTLKITEPKNSQWLLAHFEKVRAQFNPHADQQHSEDVARAVSRKAEEPQLGLF